MSEHYDVLFIGSGISSLTGAALLAKKGKKVAVLEQHYKAGGYMHCFRRFGARFDTGAHYAGALSPGAPFHTILSYLEVYKPELFIELDETGFDQFHFPDRQFFTPKGYHALLSHLSENFPKETASIKQFLGLIRNTVELFQTYTFHDKIDNDALFRCMNTSLEKVISEHFEDPALKAFFYAYCSLHGVLPHETPFGMQAVFIDSFVRGSYGFRKGGDALTESFVDVLEKYGAQIQLKHRVSKLITENKSIREVQCENGRSFTADLIISGVHPKITFSLVDDPHQFSKAFLNRVEKIEESSALFCLYGTANEVPLQHNRNYFSFPSYDPQEMFYSKSPKKPGAVFLAPAERDSNLGRFSFNAIVQGPHSWFSEWSESQYRERPSEYEDFKKVFSQSILQTIDRSHPGFSEKIERYCSSSSLTNLHFNGSPEGSSYGLYHSFENTGMKAWGPRTHIKNLLLTGQSTLFPGLLGACISGLRSSGHILGIKGILEELRKVRENS